MTNNVWLLAAAAAAAAVAVIWTLFFPFLRAFVSIPMYDLFGIQFF